MGKEDLKGYRCEIMYNLHFINLCYLLIHFINFYFEDYKEDWKGYRHEIRYNLSC